MEIFGRLQLYNFVIHIGYVKEWIRKELFLEANFMAYLSKANPTGNKNNTPFLFLKF